MMQVGNQGPDNVTGILKFIRMHFVLEETRVKIPDFSQVFIQLPPHASYFRLHSEARDKVQGAK